MPLQSAVSWALESNVILNEGSVLVSVLPCKRIYRAGSRFEALDY